MHWWDEQMLAPLFEVNERMLRLVPDAWIRVPSAYLGPCLDEATARARLARCPFLLVDVGLDEPERWFVSEAATTSFFTCEEATALTRMTFFLAWSMARTNPQAASLALGFTLHAASRIASLRLDDLCRIAQARWSSARPRWIDRPHVWRRLSKAAARHADVPERMQWLRAMQLLFWECMQERRPHGRERRELVAGGFIGAH